MDKIYSRPRIKIPKVIMNRRKKICGRKIKIKLIITIIIVIAFSTVKIVIDAVNPIYDTLCENRAKSIATIVCNEQAINIMREYSYDDFFTIEKDSNDNITMIKSNVISINEIISDIAIKIQEEIDKKGKENIEIALR